MQEERNPASYITIKLFCKKCEEECKHFARSEGFNKSTTLRCIQCLACHSTVSTNKLKTREMWELIEAWWNKTYMKGAN